MSAEVSKLLCLSGFQNAPLLPVLTPASQRVGTKVGTATWVHVSDKAYDTADFVLSVATEGHTACAHVHRASRLLNWSYRITLALGCRRLAKHRMTLNA
jgi:hypothetical protein